MVLSIRPNVNRTKLEMFSNNSTPLKVIQTICDCLSCNLPIARERFDVVVKWWSSGPRKAVDSARKLLPDAFASSIAINTVK